MLSHLQPPNALLAQMAIAEAVHGMLTPGNQPARSLEVRIDQAKYYTESNHYTTRLVASTSGRTRSWATARS